VEACTWRYRRKGENGGDWSQTQAIDVLMDPRSESSVEDLSEQFEFLLTLRDRNTEMHDAVRAIHAMRNEIVAARASLTGTGANDRQNFVRLDEIDRKSRIEIDDLEDHLRQKRAVVWQDTVNFEPLLDDQLAWLASYLARLDSV
jgi:hypothetical protein